MDMMRPPNICRTCLKRTHQTFSTQQNIDDTGQLKISLALRYLIPELYLGLSTNPEICQDCKESLKSAYNFKKMCLYTENVIGTFLKKSRCTAQSVDLHDVLQYLETDKLNREKNSVKATIISEWEDDSSEDLNDEQSKKRSENEKTTIKNEERINLERKNLSFCEETGLFVSEDGTFFNAHGTKIDDSQIKKEKENMKKKINSLFEISSVYSLSDVQNAENKLNSPISLTPKEKLFPSPNLSHFKPIAPREPTSTQLVLDKPIKQVMQSSSEYNQVIPAVDSSEYNFVTQETGIKPTTPIIGRRIYYVKKPSQNKPFLNPLSSQLPVLPMVPNYKIFKSKLLQQKGNIKIKKSLPTFSKNSFQKAKFKKRSQKRIKPLHNVSTNKALEPLHIETDSLNIKEEPVDLYCQENFLEQDEDTLTAPESIAYENNLQDIIDNLEQDDTSQYVDVPEFVMINKFSIKDLQDLKNSRNLMVNSHASHDKESQPTVILKANRETSAIKPVNPSPSKTDKTLSEPFLTKAKNVKTKDVLTFAATSLNLEGLLEEAKSTHPISNDLKNTTVEKTRERREKLQTKRRLKIVPVTDTSTGVDHVEKPYSCYIKNQKGSGYENKLLDMYPKLSMDGTYINDHDYLHSPYIRHNILMQKPNGWTCMCFICGSSPIISRHLSHMYTHGSQCKICFLDLGTPLTLNFHVKKHFKHCLVCKVRVAYGDMENHERWHVGGMRSVLRKKWNDTEPKTEDKPEPEEDSSDSDNIELAKLIKNQPKNLVEEKKNDSQHSPEKNNSRKRVKNPCCKLEDIIEPSSRVLRSKVKKIDFREESTTKRTTDPTVDAGGTS